MSLYKIGSIVVEAEIVPVVYTKFLANKMDYISRADIIIEQMELLPSLNELEKISELSQFIVWKRNAVEKDYEWILEDRNGFGSLVVSKDYSRVQCFFSQTLDGFKLESKIDLLKHLIDVVVECKMLQKGIIPIHAACIVVDDRAYAFTGPSGIGKSTRAKMMVDILNGHWLSGDKPAVHSEKGIVYGVPWDGKEHIHVNEEYPLLCIMNVKRAEYVKLLELDELQKYHILLKQCFIPMWDANLVENIVIGINQMMKSVPIVDVYSNNTKSSMLDLINLINNSLYMNKE